MPKNTESLNRNLFELLHSKGLDPTMLSTSGKEIPTPEEAEVFQFNFVKDGEDYGTVTISIDGLHKLTVYFSDDVANSEKEESESDDVSWYQLLNQLKRFSQKYQLSFELRNVSNLKHDMAKREYMKKKESIAEGYYPMGRKASYSDAVPSVKIVLQHSRQIEEGEQRYRNVERIFLENEQGERFLAPTTRPGIARVYARHIAEGGKPHDDRWNHIGSLCEEYSKMAGFVRATRSGQFTESTQKLIAEGINHYQALRESLGRLAGHRGYNAYFESWTPPLMEDDSDMSNINELFVQETVDPRIESVMPILSKLQKKISEMSEVNELSEWADKLIEGDEDIEDNEASDAADNAESELTEEESLTSNNPQGVPESEEHSPVTGAITRRILMQRQDLLKKYGPVAVMQAIDDVADFVGDTDEIGSSDVSGWIKQVEQSLGGVDEDMMDTIKKVGGKILDTLGHGSDEDLLKDLKTKAGVRNPENGKPSMAHSDKEERVAEADELRARGGLAAINKNPRPGQIDLRNIPAGNYPGSQNQFTDKDRKKHTDNLKAKIKSTLGKHTRPNLPEQGVAEGVADDTQMGTVSGTNNKMTLGQWKQMWQKKMPNADRSLFRFPPSMSGSAIAYFDGWENTPGARWDPQQGVAEEQLGEIGDTPAGRAALGAVQNRAYGTMDAWSANPTSGYSSTPKDVRKATSAGVAAGNRLHGFGPDNSRTNTVMARDALRQKQGMAEGEFAGDYATGEAGQWRNKGPKANKPATIGDLVGEGQDDLDTIRRLVRK